MTRRRRQLQTQSSLLLLRSVILENGDGLRVETNAHSGNVFFSLLTRSLKSCLCTHLLFSFISCLFVHPFARLKHLVLQYVRNYMYSTDTLSFLLLFYFLLSCSALRTGICRLSVFYSIVFIHTVRILYSAGCLVRNKATLVMHLGMVSR